MSDFGRLKDLVSDALELPGPERDAFLVRNCDDPQLLAEARALIAHDADAAARFTSAVGDKLAGTTAELFGTVHRRERIDRYEILEVLGHGGMGVVYRARQAEDLDREVALKLIRPGFDSEKVIARFESERQALARMEHPGIARVFDAGSTADGLPWFAMEYVDGSPINEWCDAHSLDLASRVDLFGHVCHAIQHAHQKGVIHRDLKPTNILVARLDGMPVPKVIDFGISKALGDGGEDGVLATVEGQLVGTPEYMSPERFASEDVDTRADVYSLGVVLFQLLTGGLPFARGPATLTDRSSLDADPPRPSTKVTAPARETEEVARRRATRPRQLRSMLEGDLDWITLKALAPRPDDRYATVQALLDDIERHRKGYPVLAGPPTVRYRIGKYVRRHRAAISVATLILVVLLGGLIESNRQRVRAESALAEADAVTAFLSDMLASARAEELGEDVTVQQVLDRAATSLAEQLAGRDLVRARLLTTIGRTYHAIGRLAEAEERLEEAVRIRERELGPNAPETLDARAYRAIVLRDRGELDGAITEMELVLRLRRGLLGDRHPKTLGTLTDLGGCYQQNGDVDQASACFDEAWRGFLEAFGPHHPDTIDAMLNLGNLMAENGDPVGAEALLEPAMRASEEGLGPHHPQTISATQSLALLRYDQGDLAECERLLTVVLESRRQAHGPGHPKVLESMINLGSVRSGMGKLDSSIELLEQALPIARASLGDEHRITLTCMNNLTWAYGEAGRDGEAEPLLEELVATRRRVRGDDHLFTLISWNNLGELYLRTGRPREAEAVHRQVLELRRRSLGDEHPHVMISMTNLASALRDQGRGAEAEALYEESWARQSALLGPTHPDATRTAEEAARLCATRDCATSAATWKDRARGD